MSAELQNDTLGVDVGFKRCSMGKIVVASHQSFQLEHTEGKFRHDAFVCGGSSGSPIFDRFGFLVGMHVRGLGPENIGFGYFAHYFEDAVLKLPE